MTIEDTAETKKSRTKKTKADAETKAKTKAEATGVREASFIRAVYEYVLTIAVGESRAEYRVHKIVVGVDTTYEIYRATASKMMPIGTFKTKNGIVSTSDAANPKFKSLCASVATAFCDSSDTRTRGEKIADKGNPEAAAHRKLEAKGQTVIPETEDTGVVESDGTDDGDEGDNDE